MQLAQSENKRVYLNSWQIISYSKKIRRIKIKITRKHKVIVSKIYQFTQGTDCSLLCCDIDTLPTRYKIVTSPFEHFTENAHISIHEWIVTHFNDTMQNNWLD